MIDPDWDGRMKAQARKGKAVVMTLNTEPGALKKARDLDLARRIRAALPDEVLEEINMAAMPKGSSVKDFWSVFREGIVKKVVGA